MKWTMHILAFLSFVLLAAAGVVYFTNRGGDTSDATQAPFVVGQTEFVLTDIEPGVHELIVTLTNTATVPRHIIGVAEG